MASSDLVVRIIGESKEFTAGLKKAEGDLNRFGQKTSATSRAFKVAGAAIIGSAVAIGASSIKAAVEGQKANAQLQQSIKNVGGSYDVYKKQIDETADRLANFGFEHHEVEQALTVLTRATKDPAKALKDMGLAADIARARNISLADASQLLGKVELGRFSILTRLGVASKEQVKDLKSTSDATNLLAGLYGGAAQANAETFAGKMEALSAKAKNLEEQFGNVLLPIVSDLADAFVAGLGKLQAFNEATGGLAGKAALAVAGGLAMIAVIGKIVTVGKAGAASISSLVETIQIWVLLNPELAVAIALVTGAAAILTLGLRDNAAAHKKDTEAAKNFTDAVRNEGLTLGQAVSRELTDFLTKHEKLAPILEKAGISAEDVGKAVAGSAADYQSVIDKITDYSNKTGELPGVLNDFVNELDHQRAGLAISEKQLKFNKDVTTGLNAATKGLTAASGQGATAANKVADAHKKQAEESKKAADAELKLRDAILSSANADLAYEQAIADVADRVKELHDRSIPLAQAQRDVRSSILDVAGAAAQQTKALAEANNKQATATQLRQSELRALTQLKAKYPELRKEIDLYIRRLGLIPSKVNTNVNLAFTGTGSVGKVSGSGINVTVNLGGGKRGFADGGFVPGPKGAPMLATVHGGEFVVSNAMQRRGGGGSTITVAPTIVVQETNAGDRMVRQLINALNVGSGKTDLRRALGV